MNKFFPQHNSYIAAAGGLAGFFVVFLATAIVFVAALFAGGFVFGGGIHSWSDSLIVSIFVPVLISIGAAIPPWILGDKFWRGLFAGVIAMIVFIYIELNGGHQVNYGIFSQRETLAYISAILVSMLISVAGRKEFQAKGYVTILALSTLLVGLRFLVPEVDFVIGIVVSLLAWILLPPAVAYFYMPEQNGKSL